MADNLEEDLLRSIDEVEARIQAFRKRVQGVLTDIQSAGEAPVDTEEKGGSADTPAS
ncbi:MAG: hypothetical protein GKR89_27770 [Candidatus Latescibacteria bacterium]|nr:hypothetical protein [Candidatus Latescibacterota bacterium]